MVTKAKLVICIVVLSILAGATWVAIAWRKPRGEDIYYQQMSWKWSPPFPYDKIEEPRPGSSEWDYAYYRATYDADGRMLVVAKMRRGEVIAKLYYKTHSNGEITAEWQE